MRFSPLPRFALFIVGIFLTLAGLVPLPYVVLQPGAGTDVLEKMITIEGAPTYPTSGKLLLVTVLATSPGSPIFGANVLYSWAKADSIVLPRSVVYPPEQSSQEINAVNKADMDGSQSAATVSAFSYLEKIGTPVDPRKVKVRISVKNTGGPSGGLIFALAVIARLTPNDFLDGRTIAGTGTIDAQGVIGPIGGIDEKLIAAKRSGATVFLAPTSNCDDVHHIPSGLTVYSVETLTEAISVLKDAQTSISHCTWQRNR
ncbi:MAG: hypothetical protein D4R83_01730 [Streptomycetaceae bacterium]|nr:MAG: hypothetical protein D4R83_01730 [Streptomycetaceae bacterium]